VRAQLPAAQFVALDSMNLWIEIARDSLLGAIENVDCLILNDAELRQLTGKPNLVSAAREILAWGPSVIVAKQGRVRRRARHARELLRAARLSPGDRDRPDRRRRLVRWRVRRLPRGPPERLGRRPPGGGEHDQAGADGAPSDDLLRPRDGARDSLASFNVEEFGTERVQR